VNWGCGAGEKNDRRRRRTRDYLVKVMRESECCEPSKTRLEVVDLLLFNNNNIYRHAPLSNLISFLQQFFM
jgi:hypothetical protein